MTTPTTTTTADSKEAKTAVLQEKNSSVNCLSVLPDCKNFHLSEDSKDSATPIAYIQFERPNYIIDDSNVLWKLRLNLRADSYNLKTMCAVIKLFDNFQGHLIAGFKCFNPLNPLPDNIRYLILNNWQHIGKGQVVIYLASSYSRSSQEQAAEIHELDAQLQQLAQQLHLTFGDPSDTGDFIIPGCSTFTILPYSVSYTDPLKMKEYQVADYAKEISLYSQLIVQFAKDRRKTPQQELLDKIKSWIKVANQYGAGKNEAIELFPQQTEAIERLSQEIEIMVKNSSNKYAQISIQDLAAKFLLGMKRIFPENLWGYFPDFLKWIDLSGFIDSVINFSTNLSAELQDKISLKLISIATDDRITDGRKLVMMLDFLGSNCPHILRVVPKTCMSLALRLQGFLHESIFYNVSRSRLLLKVNERSHNSLRAAIPPALGDKAMALVLEATSCEQKIEIYHLSHMQHFCVKLQEIKTAATPQPEKIGFMINIRECHEVELSHYVGVVYDQRKDALIYFDTLPSVSKDEKYSEGISANPNFKYFMIGLASINFKGKVYIPSPYDYVQGDTSSCFTITLDILRNLLVAKNPVSEILQQQLTQVHIGHAITAAVYFGAWPVTCARFFRHQAFDSIYQQDQKSSPAARAAILAQRGRDKVTTITVDSQNHNSFFAPHTTSYGAYLERLAYPAILTSVLRNYNGQTVDAIIAKRTCVDTPYVLLQYVSDDSFIFYLRLRNEEIKVNVSGNECSLDSSYPGDQREELQKYIDVLTIIQQQLSKYMFGNNCEVMQPPANQMHKIQACLNAKVQKLRARIVECKDNAAANTKLALRQ